MALSRFSVLPDQRIVNTHVAQDLSLANKVLSTKQGAYDEAQAFDQQSEGTFAKHQVRNADIGRRDQLHDEYQQKAQDLVGTKYQGDYGAAMPELKKLANSYASNEFWNRSSSAMDREKEDYKLREQLRKEGKNVLDFAPGMSQKAIYNKDGTYNDISYNTQGQSDWMKGRKEALGKIEASGGSGGLRGAGVAGLLQHIDNERVGLNDVQRVAMANFQGYFNGSEGQQEYRYLRAQGRSDKDSRKEVLMNLAAAGENQIHNINKTNYLGIPGWAEAQKAEKELENDQGVLPISKNPYSFHDAEWSEDGQHVTNLPKNYGGPGGLMQASADNEKTTGGARKAALGILTGGWAGNNQSLPDQIFATAKGFIAGGKDTPDEKQKQVIANLSEAAKRNNMTPKQLSESLKDVNHGFDRYNDPKKIKAESDAFYDKERKSGNFTTRKIYTDDHPEGRIAADVMPQYDKKDGRGGFTVIGATHPDNMYTSKGKVVQWETDKGPVTAVMDDSRNANELEKFAWNQNQAKYKGTSTFKSRITTNKSGRPVMGPTEHTYRSVVIVDKETGDLTTKLELVN